MGVFEHFQDRFDAAQEEELTLQDYLEICKAEPSAYATASERLLLAIGEPEFVDTAKCSRLSRIFSNKIIKRYPAFDEFYGMEEAIEQIVSFFRHAAQGLEEKKQILYLLGPVGGGKSSLADKLKSLKKDWLGLSPDDQERVLRCLPDAALMAEVRRRGLVDTTRLAAGGTGDSQP